MIDFFIKHYGVIGKENSILNAIKYYSLKRYIIRIIANILVPLRFNIQLFINKDKFKLSNGKAPLDMIVSLTTFPGRINKVWIVVECLLRQSYLPSKIILWLSKDQFSNESKLPKKLLDLKNRGLEIVLCEGDIRSHKKYKYALEKFHGNLLVTVDDDFIYPSTLLQELVTLHLDNSNAICCNRALKILVKDGDVLPYNKWEYIFREFGPSYNLFFTSGGGTLFPHGCFYNDVLNEDLFMKYCYYADDVWLNLMSQLNNIKVVKGFSNYSEAIPILTKNDITLSSKNVDEGLNDEQILAVRSYYMKNKNTDPLKNIVNN